MRFSRAVTVPLEIAHHGLDGVMHGHSLQVEVWTAREVDLDAFAAEVRAAIAFIGRGTLEETIAGRTFEDVARAAMTATKADRVVVRLPTLGHAVSLTSD